MYIHTEIYIRDSDCIALTIERIKRSTVRITRTNFSKLSNFNPNFFPITIRPRYTIHFTHVFINNKKSEYQRKNPAVSAITNTYSAHLSLSLSLSLPLSLSLSLSLSTRDMSKGTKIIFQIFHRPPDIHSYDRKTLKKEKKTAKFNSIQSNPTRRGSRAPLYLHKETRMHKDTSACFYGVRINSRGIKQQNAHTRVYMPLR